MVRACIDVGLVKGEGFAVDAGVMEADASRYHGRLPDEIDWSLPERQTRAVAEFLQAAESDFTGRIRIATSIPAPPAGSTMAARSCIERASAIAMPVR